MVALVLETLQVFDHAVDCRAVEAQAQLVGLHGDSCFASHFRNEEPRAVANQLGRHMFVRIFRASDCRHVQTGLVCEGRRTNVRRLRVHWPVQYLGNKVAYLCQSL